MRALGCLGCCTSVWQAVQVPCLGYGQFVRYMHSEAAAWTRACDTTWSLVSTRSHNGLPKLLFLLLPRIHVPMTFPFALLPTIPHKQLALAHHQVVCCPPLAGIAAKPSTERLYHTPLLSSANPRASEGVPRYSRLMLVTCSTAILCLALAFFGGSLWLSPR